MRPTREQVWLALKYEGVDAALELTRQIEEYWEFILGPYND